MKEWCSSSCLQEQQQSLTVACSSRCPKQHREEQSVPPPACRAQTNAEPSWTPLSWTKSWDQWNGLTLGSAALGQLSTVTTKPKPRVITLLSLPLLLRDLVQNSFISAVYTSIKTTQSTVRWGRRKTMNFHHIDISGPIYITTTSLVMGSNKYPLPGSHCQGWERKQQPKGCHILETWPGKKDPQLTRWVRESWLSLEKKTNKPHVANSFKTSQILSMNFQLIGRIQRGAISILDREGADL